MLGAWLLVGAMGLDVHAEEPTARKFRVITLPSDEICRAWVLPTDEAMALKRWPSLPGVYMEELDMVRLSGRLRYKSAMPLAELLRSKKLEALDLSYVDLRADELESVSKCASLKHLCLSGVKLTLPMIKALESLQHLESLNLYQVDLNTEQLATITAALPTVKIETKQPTVLAATCSADEHAKEEVAQSIDQVEKVMQDVRMRFKKTPR